MKKSSPSSPPLNMVGATYWRSLEELAATPEFKAMAAREFPEGASELPGDFNRRDFVKLISASLMLAGVGLTGCRRPEEHIYPFANKPQSFTHGVPEYFATSMPDRLSGIPLLAKAQDGRPVKLEGNPEHPDSHHSGGTSAFAQASILNLYDPDRAMRFSSDGHEVGQEEAIKTLEELAAEANKNGGKGLHVLLDQSSSPSRARLLSNLQERFPQAGFYQYEPVDFSSVARAATLACGQPVTPLPRFEKSRVILSLDADFLGMESDSNRNAWGFAQGRKIKSAKDPMNRLYVVEGLLTLTGGAADHRLRMAPGRVLGIAAQMALAVFQQVGQRGQEDLVKALDAIQKAAEADFQASLSEKDADQFQVEKQFLAQWVEECAKDLAAHQGKSLVVVGYAQPLAVHLIGLAINSALKNFNTTLEFIEDKSPQYKSLEELTQVLGAGEVETLVLVGGNPAYNTPADLKWNQIVGKASRVIRFGYYEDETSFGFGLHIPAAHYLESWGDLRARDGSLLAVQPLIEPLFGGISELEFLARLGGLSLTKPYDIVRETFKDWIGKSQFEEEWKRFLHDGFLKGSSSPFVKTAWKDAEVVSVLNGAKAAIPSSDNLQVVFFRDPSVDDGRFSNNGWLQETPDPITKMTWDNVVLVSPKTAESLGLKSKQGVRLSYGELEVEGPVWIQPGLADFTLGIALGYGRERSGRVGGVGTRTVGFNAYHLRPSSAPYILPGVSLEKTTRVFTISCTQDHSSMEARPIVREANLAQYEEKPDFAHNMDLEAHSRHIPTDAQGNPKGIYKHPYQARPELMNKVHQWGMAIDLNSCVGCNACMVACQSENNIPFVGKDQVGNSREMHWIRIDRYYTGDVEDPQVALQPMLCQHCESAPCESVCPVNATVHDDEGLNVMVYNRCVGTRYCSNNCPYKVRRFNFFDYNKRPLDQLMMGPLASRSDLELELIKLSKNPDVTVRMRGVMEKCTYCVQRIEQAKIAQKIKARNSDDVEVPDKTVLSACQQACPTEAIAFGNILDEQSEVSQWKALDRNYSVLGFLDTRPRTTYLARIRNPNPSMPDYREMPESLKEYSDKMGNPMESHGSGHAEAHGSAAEGGHSAEGALENAGHGVSEQKGAH